MNRFVLKFCVAFVFIAGSMWSAPDTASADRFRRQYYSQWDYHPARQYHFRRYFYTPTVQVQTHHYHYVINYPRRPRFHYYYNPRRQVYWGRFEFNKKGEPMGYSLLKPEDRKASLDDIPDSAFPKPGKMPPIPDSKDGETILPPPKDSPVPKDLPAAIK